jgi:hypothetical protein
VFGAGHTNGADTAGALFVWQRRTSIKSNDVSYVPMRFVRGSSDERHETAREAIRAPDKIRGQNGHVSPLLSALAICYASRVLGAR